ncbi:MAG: hypothetical protein ABR498_03675 [Candidatus Dormibacteria bacterium]
MVDQIAGYCGRCGMPFTAASGAFCARCGNALVAPPPVAFGYSYPVMPPATVPAAQTRLPRRRLLVIGGATLAVVVVVVTLVAVVVRPGSKPCGFYCGPVTGQPLVSSTIYANQKWGYSVEYDKAELSLAKQDDNGVQFDSAKADGSLVFTATAGGDVGGANQRAYNGLDTSAFQNLQSIGPVRGAEIGFVNGQGTAYQGQFSAPSSSASEPVGLVIFSATRGGVTITVTAFSAAASDNDVQPYGLALGEDFDFAVSHTMWKGQQ